MKGIAQQQQRGLRADARWGGCGGAPALRRAVRRGALTAPRAEPQQQQAASTSDADASPSTSASSNPGLDRELAKFTSKTAATFAPRASTATKNPAVRGSALYWIFEVQAWVALLVGGLLSFNVIFPTDEPSIPRLMGMWSIWMFTVPSLRAKECLPKEKEALNYLFLLIPLVNVTLPFAIKSFPVIFTADVVTLVALYTYKGVWQEVYGAGGAPAAGDGGDA